MTNQQTAAGRDSISQGLLQALRLDEAELAKAHQAYLAAYSAWDVAGRRYAAMREAVRERIGQSPYAKGVEWPQLSGNAHVEDMLRRGRFRYIRMDVGEAVVEVLQEADEPLDLGRIVPALRDGGLVVRDARTVNAALINTKGVKNLQNGTYEYEKPETEEEDLPW